MNLILFVIAATPGLPTDPCAEGSAFAVSSPALEIAVGEKVVLTAFSTHRDRALRYTWRLVSAPEASTQQVDDPIGTTFERTKGCQHAYFDGAVPTFTPDRSGRYELELIAFDVSTGERAVGTKIIDARLVTTPAQGCSSAPTLALFLLGAWWRQKRRSLRDFSRRPVTASWGTRIRT